MASIRDKRTIYVVDPVVVDDFGNKVIKGYNNLKKYDFVLCVPANSENDIATYGNEVSTIMKFQCNFDIDVLIDGGNGIYFEEPIADDEGLYQEPTYITKPLTVFNSTRLFDGQKQTY